MREKIEKIKKVELHIHLDGSVQLSTIAKISGKKTEELTKEMIAPHKCKNLSEYLTKFDLSIKYMQTKENLIQVSKELVDYLESQNVIYAEIRFAPMFHTKEGLTYDEVVEAVLEGINENKKVKTNLILCLMKGFPEKENIETIKTAYKYLNKGVCAIDIAGAEDKYSLAEYTKFFEIAKEKNIPFTIHAGENGDYKQIDLAISLGAKRIGHGIHAIDSNDTQSKIKEKNILLEICPTSNVQTNSLNEYCENPIKKFYKDNIKVCINTDNKTVSNINLNDEYLKLYKEFNFTISDFNKMNEYAINSSFISQKEKIELLKELNTKEEEKNVSTKC